ncbi:MAG: exodeoxyribonuclease VII large subunit [Atopobiaceae bacterium]|nr:exodeoxyribonuclease VII large subunit [Atopobiaceae bacterium]
MAQAQPVSVSDAVGLAKATVDNMPTLLVTGEVSGFRGPARTGHCYFQLKDDSSAMDAIVWRGIYQSSGVQLRDGLQVLVAGHFQVYAPTGKLSFVARSLEVSGEGLLRQQVAALARRLEAEGLMDPARKRAIPVFCTRVAVVTSPTGSVIDDVKRTLARRNPLVELLVSGCAVQGEGAPQQIVHALARAAAARPDAILLVRGGGSFEDLMTFNDEALARAVATCPVPVITGIGHEPDTCICDMVADRRCSTPTAAAESVAPAFDEILRSFQDRRRRLAHSMGTLLAQHEQLLDTLDARGRQAVRGELSSLELTVQALAGRRCLSEPEAMIQDRADQLELTAQRLHEGAPRTLALLATQVDALAAHRCLQDPMAPVKERRERVEHLSERLADAGPRVTANLERQLGSLELRTRDVGPRLLRQHAATLAQGAAQLDALSPLKVLSRGYAIARDADGHVVSDAARLDKGDEISVLLGSGGVYAQVTDTFDTDDTAARRAAGNGRQ